MVYTKRVNAFNNLLNNVGNTLNNAECRITKMTHLR